MMLNKNLTHTISNIILITVAAVALTACKKTETPAAQSAGSSGGAASSEKIKIVFAHHSSASNTFWQAVKKGFDDACGKINADCQMVFTQNEGAVQEQLSNIEAALARKPDALLTSIVDSALDEVIQKARNDGIIVIAVNVDAAKGAAGNARQAFVGQGFVAAGYSLGKAQSANFPAKGPIKILVGVSAPGQNWSEQRAQGIINFLKEYKAAHPDRKISWERLDSGTDLAITSDRVGAYLTAHPDTTAYFDTGFWHAGVARVLADRNIAPNKILLGGFDLVPEVVEQMTKGYVQVQIDQQPYMQGFMPVMEVYLAKTVGLSPADIDTGQGVITADKAAQLSQLVAKGVR